MSVTTSTIADLGRRARAASSALAIATTGQKNDALRAAADRLLVDAERVLEGNQADLVRGEVEGVSVYLLDRLRLDGSRLEGMASGLRQVADLEDPIGEVTAAWDRPNGLRISKVRVPLGVVAIIYEMRPNVTSDAFGLCLKSGNVAFLRGSSAALESNRAIAASIRAAVGESGLPNDALVLVEDVSHEAAVEFMQLRDSIDCLIPRGGPSLIRSILDNATVPYVIDGDGNCHVYVDASADLDMAVSILHNAKTHRPSVCNAAESLVVHADVAEEFLPMALAALDLKISVRVVTNLDEAIEHVNQTGSGHSEAIVTSDEAAAERFCNEVDAGAVLLNASTRFVDGEEFGFGAEIGISTQKLHARGPMGLTQLTTEKYVVRGDGQVRA